MTRTQLSLAISAAVLSGCSFVSTQDGPELRAKANQPLCLTDCHITVNTSEGVQPTATPSPATPEPVAVPVVPTETPIKETPP